MFTRGLRRYQFSFSMNVHQKKCSCCGQISLMIKPVIDLYLYLLDVGIKSNTLSKGIVEVEVIPSCHNKGSNQIKKTGFF